MAHHNVTLDTALPAWMKQAKRGIDWGALLIIGFCILASWNFITTAELSATNDNEAYIYRTADYADAFASGIFYMRWSPEVLNGYGAPIPHFYPSGATYISGLITYLFTNDPILSLRTIYTFLFVFAGSATYTLITQRTNALSGLIGGIVYIFNPFVQYAVPYQDGNLPLMMAIALLPMSVWAVNRLLIRHQPIDVFLISTLIALLIITYPLMLPPALLTITILVTVHSYTTPTQPSIIPLILSILLGFVIASFYWLPALMHMTTVAWLDHPVTSFSATLNWDDLLSPVRVLDTALLRPLPIYQLGWGIVFVTILSGLLLPVRRKNNLLPLIFLISGVLTLCIVIIVSSTRIEWLAFVFLCIAITTSYLGRILVQRPRLNSILSMIIMGVVILSGMPQWRLPVNQLLAVEPDDISTTAYEQLGYGIAGMPHGDSIPSNLSLDFVLSNSAVANDDNRLIAPNLTATLLESDIYRSSYNVNTSTGGDFIYQRAHFEGWHAQLGTQRLTIAPSADNLVTINIPPDTNNNLDIQFRSTFQWNIIWGISLLSFLTSIVYWAYRWRRIPSDYDDSDLLEPSQVSLILLFLLSMFAVRIAIDNLPENVNFLTQQPQYTLQESAVYVRNRVDDNLLLLAFTLSDEAYQANQIIEFIPYWELLSPVNQPYVTRIRLTSVDNMITITNDYVHVGNFPNHRLNASTILPQIIQLSLPSDIPAGQYIVFVDVATCNLPCLSIPQASIQPLESIRILRPITIIE